MTLCLTRALADDEPPTMDVRRQLDHYLRWPDEGWCSSNGHCFDIGNQTREALIHHAETGALEAPLNSAAQGNGALMRAVPVPIWLTRWKPDAAIVRVPASASPEAERIAGRFARLEEAHRQDDDQFRTRAALYRAACVATHHSPVCVAAAVIYSEMVFHALLGAGKHDVVELGAHLVDGVLHRHPEFQPVFAALTRDLAWEDFEASGWVINALAIACWALRSFESFEAGMIDVVNMRGDADTNGAVFGGLAGAVYGIEAIPERWLHSLKARNELEEPLGGLSGPGSSARSPAPDAKGSE